MEDILKKGSREDKTRVEICELLRMLCDQLSEVVKTISDIEKTLYNEEYEDSMCVLCREGGRI